MKYVLIGLLVFAGFVHSAQHGSAAGLIDNITVKETGYIHIRFESNHANTMECGVGNTVVISASNQNKDEMYSLSLAAFASSKPVSYWITGCYSYYGTSFPVATTAGVSK